MENTIILDFPTRNIKKDLSFKNLYTISLKEMGFSDGISYEDKVLVEKALEDFRVGRVSSQKKIVRLLNE